MMVGTKQYDFLQLTAVKKAPQQVWGVMVKKSGTEN